jgi:hypothetical protein
LVVTLVVVSLTVAGCSTGVQGSATSREIAPASVHASTARGVIDALDAEGLAVQHPLDTTEQVCPRLGCLQSIVCDTLRVTAFPTSALARRSVRLGVDSQAGRFVVRFAPPVTEADKAHYWDRIRRIVATKDR